MFKKTKLKIQYTIMIFLGLFVIIESVFSIISIHNELLKNYQNGINDSIDLSIANCKSNIATALSASTHVVNLGNNITEQSLNNLKQVTFCINGVSYYPLVGEVLHTNGMSGLPTLNELLKIPEIKAYYENDNKEAIYSLRTEVIPSYYSASSYDASYGIISYINKVYQDDLLIGYLFVDISPYFLYRTFFDYRDYTYFNNYASFIIFSHNTYFHYQNNDRYASYISEIVPDKIVTSHDHSCFIVTREIKQIDTYLSVVIPKDAYYLSFINTIMPVIVLSLAFIFLGIFIAIYISKRIVLSLSKLNTKMANASNKIKKDIEN